MKPGALLLCSALLASLPAWASKGLYKCTDASGHVTLTDQPCQRGAETVLRAPTPDPPADPAPGPQPFVGPPAGDAEIEIDEGPAGATAAYAEPPRPSYAPSIGYVRPPFVPRIRRGEPSPDTRTLQAARRALLLLDSSLPDAPAEAREPRRRGKLFGFLSGK